MQAILIEASQQHGDLTEPHVETDKEATAIIKQTRGSFKLSHKKETNAAGKRERKPTKDVGRKKNLPKGSLIMHPKKKGKKVTIAIVDTVLGNLQELVADVVEFCQKRDKDAMRCGHTTNFLRKAVNLDPMRIEMRTQCKERVT